MMERRSLLKWLGGLAAGILLATQSNAKDQDRGRSDRLGQLLLF